MIEFEKQEVIKETPLGRLILAGAKTERLIPSQTATFSTEEVLAELDRRRVIGRGLIEQIAKTFVSHTNLKELRIQEEIATYEQFMRAVARALPKRFIEEDIPAHLHAEYGKKLPPELEKAIGEAGWRAKEFKKPKSQLHPNLRALASHAERQAVNILFYRRERPATKTPLFVAAKARKLLPSITEKIARQVAARTDPTTLKLPPSWNTYLGPYDSTGVKVACASLADVYEVNTLLNSSGVLEAAVDIPTNIRCKDYLRSERIGRRYRAFHQLMRLNPRHTYGIIYPDPIEVQLFTGDGTLFEFFDPQAGHFTHQDKKVERQEQERLVEGNWKRVRNVTLNEAQQQFCRELNEKLLDQYALVATQLGYDALVH